MLSCLLELNERQKKTETSSRRKPRVTTSDNQVRKLMEEMNKHGRIGIASLKAGMDTKTGRKYIKSGKLPSELKLERYWHSREDPFFEINGEIQKKLQSEPFLTDKRLFIEFQELYPGKFDDKSLRTFQRKIESWRKSNNTIETTKAWLQSLQQGCIDLCELKKQYSHVITDIPKSKMA